jgi:hypothetical protein
MTYVLVSGPMRSGTSLVASMLHHMGVPMALTVLAPQAPRWQFEWEDCDLTTAAIRSFPIGETQHKQRVRSDFLTELYDFLHRSADVHARIADQWGQPAPLTVGVKMPLLLNVWDEARAIFGPRLKRVLLHRPEAATRASLAASCVPTMRDAAIKTNGALHELAAKASADLVLDYDLILADPFGAAERLGALVGICDLGTIRRGAAMVRV